MIRRFSFFFILLRLGFIIRDDSIFIVLRINSIALLNIDLLKFLIEIPNILLNLSSLQPLVINLFWRLVVLGIRLLCLVRSLNALIFVAAQWVFIWLNHCSEVGRNFLLDSVVGVIGLFKGKLRFVKVLENVLRNVT